MHYVYLIRSKLFPEQTYIGLASDLQKRLAAHNSGQSSHTKKYKPWELVTYIGFVKEEKAVAFEKYLKSGSGRAFARKRLWS
ncbi:MAG: putative endonuclease [Desulfuromonadales bacterium]|jgi:predicted GIY-YIG superfamily endonuclease|nr:putative endonuclease [Desulfuromonadales bacterium]